VVTARGAEGGPGTEEAELDCDPYHTGVWALSQPDVTLWADTKFVPVRARDAKSAV